MAVYRRNNCKFRQWQCLGWWMGVSTSYPDGNWANEKNCTWLHSEKPTHGRSPGGCSSDYIGRFFLHFTITIL